MATNNTLRVAPISLPVFRSRWLALGKRELWEQTFWKNKGNNRILVNRFTAHLHLWRMPEMVAPRALVYRPLGKGNEALGTRLWQRSRLPPMRALASHQCVLGSIPEPGVKWGLSFVLVLYSFSGYSGFLRSSGMYICEFQFDPEIHGHFWTSSCELPDAPWANKLLFYFKLDNW